MKAQRIRVPLTEPLKVELSLEADVKYENKLLLCYFNQQIIHKERDSILCYLSTVTMSRLYPTYRESNDTDIQYTAGEHPPHFKAITMCVCINTQLKPVVNKAVFNFAEFSDFRLTMATHTGNTLQNNQLCS